MNYRQKSFGSIFKLVKYLGCLTKEPMTVEILGKKESYFPPDRVIISDKFFRSAKCKRCGRSCNVDFSLAFTHSDVMRMNTSFLKSDRMYQLRKGLQEIPVVVRTSSNSSTKSCFLYVNKNKRCDFAYSARVRRWYLPFSLMWVGADVGVVDKWNCTIHEMKPTHCAMPLIQINNYRVKESKTSSSLLKRQYGRNWAFGCPIKFEPFDYEEFVNWDLPVLRRLLVNAEDLGLNTWLGEIIDYLESNKEKFEKGELPRKSIVIKENTNESPSNL